MGRVIAFASVTMIVHEITGSPVSGFFHLSQRPAKLSTPPSAGVIKYGCLPSRLCEPLVIAARRHDAAMPLGRVPEHGLIGNALGARVEACRQLLQGLFPPPWNEPPAHRDEFGGVAGGQLHDIDRISGRNVVVGLHTESSA